MMHDGIQYDPIQGQLQSHVTLVKSQPSVPYGANLLISNLSCLGSAQRCKDKVGRFQKLSRPPFTMGAGN